ncbi:uncharacterized protein CC84DRAFT_1219061 [Paraphaeosphaeria sporulosa]|uniref:Uncharacterized protein n=1 Tax=Paraphaeosphaeria sporulosa TaxID=1460663 RepID=A0A177C7S0_9PLEO|nr:uncharacterized protein CC84DRAFT_1219061 [Paraphaeosphaeria sporulosa]OAG03794.1 hypothetical protein CC84DRAFT_1219061 [Paraphaeosphaeria sporulosa]
MLVYESIHQINPPPKGLTDHEKVLLRAYLQARREKQVERKRDEEKREEEGKQRRGKKEQQRKEHQEVDRLKREEPEQLRKEREERVKKAAEAKRKESGSSRRSRQRSVAERIKTKQDAAMTRAKGAQPSVDKVGTCIGWKKKRNKKNMGASDCLFCGGRMKTFFFLLPDGVADACSPCKKALNHIALPSKDKEE